MGFDNDCILNIPSVSPEYFCPVCRTLVYPGEALQTQCCHLYCKLCLVHIASGVQTCPYDGNLVTEAGAKPLTLINRTLAEAIGKIAVRCLYHRSGCMWQGLLSECIVHCSGCAFGDSQVICMKCQIQIAHRQAEEHAQICNVNQVMEPEVQQGPTNVWDAATSGATVFSDQSKTAIQGRAPTGRQITPADNLNQPALANPQSQALPAMVMSTSQWYQPQYQQVYPQYTLQATQPFNQAPLQVQGPAQSQAHVQLQAQSQEAVQQHVEVQAHVQPLPQAQVELHPLTHALSQSQHQSQVQARPQISFSQQHGPPLHPQAAMLGPNGTQAQLNPQQQIQPTSLPHVQIQTQNQLLAHGHMPPQLSSQAPPHAVQGHAQQHMQVPPFQHSLTQVHHPQPSLWHPNPQPQAQTHTQGHPQSQSCPQLQHPHIQQVLQVPPQEHPHSQQVLQVPSQQHPHSQQVLQAPPQQHPHSQQVLLAPPPQHPHGQPVLQAPSQQHPLQVQPSTGFVPLVQVSAQFARPCAYLRPLEPPQRLPSRGQALGIPPAQQHIDPHSRPGLPVQQHPVTCQVQQPLPQEYVQLPQMSAGCTSGPLQGQLYHAGPFSNQAPARTTKQQEYKPQFVKNSVMNANGPGANSNEKKHGANANDEHKPENGGGDGYRQDEAVIRDAATKLQEGQGVSCYPVATQRYEGGKGHALEHFPGGNLVQDKAVDVNDVPIYVKQVEFNMNVQPPTHYKLAEHGHFSNPGQVSNLDEHFQNFHPPASNQPGSFYPQDQLSGSFAPCSAAMLPRGPNNFGHHARSFESQYEGLQRPYSHASSYGHPGFVSSSAPGQARAPIGKHPVAFQMESARHIDQGQQQFFGDSSDTMSAHPCLGGPGSQSSYTRQGFPYAGPLCADGSDSFDNLRKRKSVSMGWCRICNVDCESVQGLEMHGQTREHQQLAMKMVNYIKQKSAV